MGSRHYEEGLQEIAIKTRTTKSQARRACHDALLAAKHDDLSVGEEDHMLIRQPPETHFGSRRGWRT